MMDVCLRKYFLCYFVPQEHRHLLSRCMPAERKILKKPPIQEAIFIIAFKEAVANEQLDLFKQTDLVKRDFPDMSPGFVFEISNQSNAPAQITTSHKQEGYVLRSSREKKRLVQVRPTHLSYHNLTKYDGWETMIGELKALWSEFCTSVGENELSQLSVRYINHLKLPLPFEKGFIDYVTMVPQIPPGISPALGSFFLQVNIPEPENNLQSIITETVLGTDQGKNELNFLIDLNVTKTGPFECNKEEMWNAFDFIRDRKDDIFFKCITPKAENLFNQ